MDAKAVRLGPYDSAEDASKMFGKFIPVEVRSRLFSKPSNISIFTKSLGISYKTWTR